MANFKTHLSLSAAAGIAATGIAVNLQLIAYTHMPWFIFLVVVGGMLPDIDADNSRPVKLLFSLLAILGMFAVLHAFKNDYAPHRLLMIAAASYLLVRYGVAALFNRFTEHRGVFHSFLAALFFALQATCISFYFLHWNAVDAWLNGVFVAIGFIVHLLLDEIYSVDLSNSRMKKSFGTAMKLCSYRNIMASVLMLVCTMALYWLTPSPLPLVKVSKAAFLGNPSIARRYFSPS
ncbi:MAG: metal-dependent hydrolase [Methylovulum sp.]|nr:metal-dependent hydrolase [Methylovulum sp.]